VGGFGDRFEPVQHPRRYAVVLHHRPLLHEALRTALELADMRLRAGHEQLDRELLRLDGVLDGPDPLVYEPGDRWAKAPRRIRLPTEEAPGLAEAADPGLQDPSDIVERPDGLNRPTELVVGRGHCAREDPRHPTGSASRCATRTRLAR
jgi:hypothetical protein